MITVVGLATEFVPIAGEAPDAVVTSVKVILPKVGKGVFRSSLVRMVKEMFQVAVKEGPKAAVRYADEFAGILKRIVLKGDDTIQAFNKFSNYLINQSDLCLFFTAICNLQS